MIFIRIVRVNYESIRDRKITQREFSFEMLIFFLSSFPQWYNPLSWLQINTVRYEGASGGEIIHANYLLWRKLYKPTYT